MIVGRSVGWFMLAAALIAAGAEAVGSLEAGAWQPLGLAAPWFGSDGAGLEAARETLRSLAPAPLGPSVATLLVDWPAWLVVGVPGGLLARVFRPRRRRRRRFS